MIGFLKYEASGDYEIAARFLQIPPGQHINLPQLARQLHTLYPYFQGNLNLLSDDPNGSVEPGLPLGQVRAGTTTVSGITADLILVRVNDPVAGKIWLVSRGTVASVSQALRPRGEGIANPPRSTQAFCAKRHVRSWR